MKILAIIPFRNDLPKVLSSVSALLNAGFKKKEIVLIDDCSEEKIRNKLPNIHFLSNPKNLGWIFSTIKAVDKFKPDFFIPLGAGDTLLPGSLFKLKTAIKKNIKCGLFFWPILEIDESTKKITSVLNEVYKKRKDVVIMPCDASKYLYGKAIIGQACYNTIFWKTVGGFKSDLKWHADHFAFHLLASKYPSYFFKRPMGTFLRSKTSLSTRSERSEQYALCKRTLNWLKQERNRTKRIAIVQMGSLCVFEHVFRKAFVSYFSNSIFFDLKFKKWLFWKRVRGLIRHPIPYQIKITIKKSMQSLSTSKLRFPLNGN